MHRDMPTSSCRQMTYRGIERVSKGKCWSIDPSRCLRQKTRIAGVQPTPCPRTKGDLMKSLPIFALSASLVFLALGSRGAYAQQEIDPDHFDPPTTEPIPQPRTADSKIRVIRYHGTFSLPNSVRCGGKKLDPGKYFISVRSDGKVGHATLIQKGRAIEIARVIQTEAPQQSNEVVVEENNKNGRTLSLVRISGFAFVFSPRHSTDSSPNSTPIRTEKLPLTVIATNKIAKHAPSQASPKR